VRRTDQEVAWRGAIIGYDIPKLRAELEASRDYVFAAAGIERDLFRV
jgi:5-methylthioadenosine/S-adenosylhomocysteine deaminase